MIFAYPWVFAAGSIVLAAIGWLIVRAERARRDALARFGEIDVLGRGSSLASHRYSTSVWTLRFAALGLGVVALARPQAGERQSELVRTGRDVLVLLDLSRSMGVPDVSTGAMSGPGTRLAAAKQLTWDVMSSYPGDRVGLVVFGGSAFLQLPLSSDRASLRLFLDAASSDDLGDPATDVSAALLTAVSAFEHEGEAGRRAVLIVTDGESGEGDLDAAADALRGAWARRRVARCRPTPPTRLTGTTAITSGAWWSPVSRRATSAASPSRAAEGSRVGTGRRRCGRWWRDWGRSRRGRSPRANRTSGPIAISGRWGSWSCCWRSRRCLPLSP
jgi:hypothetical protein